MCGTKDGSVFTVCSVCGTKDLSKGWLFLLCNIMCLFITTIFQGSNYDSHFLDKKTELFWSWNLEVSRFKSNADGLNFQKSSLDSASN